MLKLTAVLTCAGLICLSPCFADPPACIRALPVPQAQTCLVNFDTPAVIPADFSAVDFDLPAAAPETDVPPAESLPVVKPAPVLPAENILPSEQNPDELGGGETELDDFAAEVIRLVNIERQNAGLPALTANAQLSAAALVRAQELPQKFDHTRPDGRSCFSVLKDLNIPYVACGENIARGSQSPEAVVYGWMHSSGHRANILNEHFTSIGVSCFADVSGTLCWAQLFTA